MLFFKIVNVLFNVAKHIFQQKQKVKHASTTNFNLLRMIFFKLYTVDVLLKLAKHIYILHVSLILVTNTNTLFKK